ncbi:MAG: MFS family permease [Cocleimonas sp.]|jgi:MFS family permease
MRSNKQNPDINLKENTTTISKSSSPLKVMLAGLFSLILTMGIARFVYTPLLPVMIDQTFLNAASGGWLATINYMGYMTGVLIAASISDLKLKDKLYRIALVLAIISTIGMGFTENYILWSLMRFVAGLSTAGGMLIGSGLILNWMIRHGHKPELGLHFGGVGAGISVTAIFAMLMSDNFTSTQSYLSSFTHAQQWQAFSLIALLMAIPAWFWLPAPNNSNLTESGKTLSNKPPRRNWMLLLYSSYFCAGIGYVISATFLVAIVDQQPELNGNGSLVWLVVGLAAAPSCLFWDRVSRKTGVLKALTIAFLINIIGIIIPAFSHSLTGVLFSGVFFGATFMGIVSLMLTMVGKFYPTKPAKPMGRLTLSYGLAQIVAPAISGTIAETTGNYAMPLIMAAVIVGIGVVLLGILQFKEQY